MRFIILSLVLMTFTLQTQPIPEPIDTWTHNTPINALARSPDGQFLVVASGDLLDFNDDGQIHIYTPDDQNLRLIVEDIPAVYGIAWRESDSVIFSTHFISDGNRFFYGWNSQTGEQIIRVPDGGTGFDLAFNPVDERLAVSYGGVLGIYDADLTLSIEESFLTIVSDGGWVDSYVMAWMPDGERIITAGHPDAPEFISMWIPSGDVTTVFEASDSLTTNGYDLHIALSPNGEWLAAAVGWIYSRPPYQLLTSDLLIWSTEDGALHHRFESTSDGVMALAWSPDGRLLASAGIDGTLTLSDVELGSVKAEWSLSRGALLALAWSSENLLAVGSYSGEVMIFDMAEIEF